jgi:hypothetical protein
VLTGSSPTPRETFSGGNVAVFITDTGVTLVDSKLAGWGQALLDKVKAVTAETTEGAASRSRRPSMPSSGTSGTSTPSSPATAR